jgi:hypothetical protein
MLLDVWKEHIENSKTLSRNTQELWEKHYKINLLSIFKKQVDYCQKMFRETKKLETQTTTRKIIK